MYIPSIFVQEKKKLADFKERYEELEKSVPVWLEYFKEYRDRHPDLHGETLLKMAKSRYRARVIYIVKFWLRDETERVLKRLGESKGFDLDIAWRVE